jgi:hypothetical protein
MAAIAEIGEARKTDAVEAVARAVVAFVEIESRIQAFARQALHAFQIEPQIRAERIIRTAAFGIDARPFARDQSGEAFASRRNVVA